MTQITRQQFEDILSELDTMDYFNPDEIEPGEIKKLESKFVEYFGNTKMNVRAVLGIDIYGYSRLEPLQQRLVPFLFHNLKDLTDRKFIKNERFLTQKMNVLELHKNFIDMGDGGFIIFDTPLHALMYALRFAMGLRVYNSYHRYPVLRNILREVTVRYAITFDEVQEIEMYSQNDKFERGPASNLYGPAIIRCARLMSKDRLNRCLIDGKTNDWFLRNLNGIDNLQNLTLQTIARAHWFKSNGYILRRQGIEPDSDLFDGFTLFRKDPAKLATQDVAGVPVLNYGIGAVDVVKLGVVQSKDEKLEAYSIQVQGFAPLKANVKTPAGLKEETSHFTFVLGNLSAQGIT